MRNAFRFQSANPANSPNTSPAQPQPSTAAFLLLCLYLHALLRHSLLLLSQPDIFENQLTPTSLVIDRRPPAVTLIIVSRNLTTLRFPLLDQAPRFNLSLTANFCVETGSSLTSSISSKPPPRTFSPLLGTIVIWSKGWVRAQQCCRTTPYHPDTKASRL
jgi:hypothetical protein